MSARKRVDRVVRVASKMGMRVTRLEVPRSVFREFLDEEKAEGRIDEGMADLSRHLGEYVVGRWLTIREKP